MTVHARARSNLKRLLRINTAIRIYYFKNKKIYKSNDLDHLPKFSISELLVKPNFGHYLRFFSSSQYTHSIALELSFDIKQKKLIFLSTPELL